ncbi:MAG TPA: ABC transporter permease [Gemmatimonadaceae bacterium]|jgi:predicted permease
MTSSSGVPHGRGLAIDLSLKHAVRRLSGAPSFALTMTGTLALCLGVNVTLLSFLITLTWRPQPGVRDARPLVQITLHDALGRLDWARPFELRTLRGGGARTLALASYAPTFATVGDTRSTAARTLVAYTSPTFFGMLGTRPLMGRLLIARDSNATELETPVVISERLWTRGFAARSDIVGQRIHVDGRPGFVVVGVAEPGFHGPEGLVQADAWLPVTDPTKEYGAARILGRLHPGFDIRAARAELGVLWQNVIREEAIAAGDQTPRQTTLALAPLRAGLHPEQSPVMQRLLGGAVAVALLVLVIACVNLAGLTLSRVLARGHEIAVRGALGSSRAQLWVDVGAELALLFLAGTALGIVIAPWIGRGLVLALATPFSFNLDVHLDGPTLALSFGLTSLAVIAATIAPGIQAMRVAPASVLRADTRSAGGSKIVQRVQTGFVAGQLASAVLLVAGVVSAAVIAKRILEFNLGVASPETLVAIEHSSPATPNVSDTVGADVLLERVRQLPSVITAVRAAQVPAGGSLLGARVRPVGVSRVPTDSAIATKLNIVSAGFFSAVGAPILRGREFAVSDDKGSPRVAVLSRSAAAHLFPATEAVGRQLIDGDSTRPISIVGIAADILYDPSTPGDQRAIYLAVSQTGASSGRMILARLRSSGSSSMRAINMALNSASESTASAHRIDELLRESTSSLRAIFSLLLAAAALAVGLALAGVYGMVAYNVRRRQREIGVRLALGANSNGVVLFFARSALAYASLAIVVSVGAWPIAARILPDAIRADASTQWLALAIAAVVLASAAGVAALVAAWRPAHVDPMRALAAE